MVSIFHQNKKKKIFTSTSIITDACCLFESEFGSIEQVQLTLFGYSLGNDGLIKCKPVDEVILRCEQTSVIVESRRKINRQENLNRLGRRLSYY